MHILKNVATFVLVLSASSAWAVDGAAKATRTNGSHTRAPAADASATLLKQHPEIRSECDRRQFEVFAADLAVEPASPSDMMATCDSQCGQGGCPYRIYKLEAGRYVKIAEFFGHFEVTSSATHGRYDISVSGSMGEDAQESFVLKFNGKEYK